MKWSFVRSVGMGVLLSSLIGWTASEAWAQGFGGRGFGGGGGFGRSSSANYPSGTQVGSATFSTDPETRKLVVVTDEETAKYISMVVSNLDRPAPQVLIKVVFLEVTHRDGSDIGVEGTYRRTDGNVNTTVLQQFNGLPGINSGNGIASFVGDDFTVTLRAIAEAGKLEVLSRPSVLARNNQQATITVGQQVPLISGISYVANFGQVNNIYYQSVGIILRVTPFITSDEMVEMIVSPEISNLSDQTVAISSDTNNTTAGAPVINTRSADTVVVTPNGQTVVIGGLMQNTKTESVSKIPVLGDLPLMGALFRRKVKNDTKTELLIFLTPYIVTKPAQLAAMTNHEKANTQITPRSFTEEQLNRFLDTIPEKGSPAPPDKAAPKKK